MIELVKMGVEDFMGIKEAKISFVGSGLWLVVGVNHDDPGRSNGACKSTIAEALAWGLYGQTMRQIKSKDDVIRRDMVQAVVIVDFNVDGVPYRIVRSRKAGAGKLSLTTWRGDTGVNRTQGTTDATQELLEKILGMDFRAFCSSVVFGGSSAFKFSALSDAERMEVLNRAIGADLYLRASEIAREKAAEAKRQFEVAEREVSRCREDLHSLRTMVERFDADMEEEEEKQKELDKHDVAGLRVATAKIVALLAKRKASDGVLKAIEGEFDQRRNQLADVIALLASKSRQIAKLEGLGSTCPTCMQQVSGSLVSTCLAALRADVQQADQLRGAAIASLDVIKERAAGARAQHEELIQREAALKAEIRDLDREVPRDSIAFDRLVRLRDEYQAGIAPAKKLLKEAKARKLALETEAATYKLLVEAFGRGGLASDAVEHAAPALDEEANRVMDAMSAGLARVAFSTTSLTKGGKEQARLTIDVQSDSGAESYGGSSEGEKAAIDLACGVAIQALVAGKSPCNVAFYDEVLDRLDEVAAERVLGLLREEAKGKRVFLVSHASWAKEQDYDGRLLVDRRNGGATVREVKG